MLACLRAIVIGFAIACALEVAVVIAGWSIAHNHPRANAAEVNLRGHVPLPPLIYQGNARAEIVTLSEAEIERRCERLMGPPTPGHYYRACSVHGRPLLYIPNPCSYQDEYAGLLCHELGHVNGWPGTHPGAIIPAIAGL